MKLHYYDDVTPLDYEPPLFRSGSVQETQMSFVQPPSRLGLGRVDCGNHWYASSIVRLVSDRRAA